MSNWSEQQFTRKGAELRAKVEAGQCKLALTKMKIGNGSVAVSEIVGMSDLKSPQLSFGISSCTISKEDNTVCEVVGVASSSNVENSFLVTEMGLYATDPDAGEILYLVCLDSVPDTMPNKNTASPVTLTYQFDIVTSNTANVTAVISPSGLVTAKAFEEHRKKRPIDHPDGSVTLLKLAEEVINRIDGASLNLLQRSKTYAVGDIAYHKALPSWARLECVRAGTTGTTLPTQIEQMIQNGGVLITDGSVIWILDDLRDGTPVGAVRGSLYLPAGYVKANGATVQRADYPRLVAMADKHNLWTDDTAANAGLFGRGDGSATMVLPNWTGRMVQLAGDGTGVTVAAGLPNVKISYRDRMYTGGESWSWQPGQEHKVLEDKRKQVTLAVEDGPYSYGSGDGSVYGGVVSIDVSKSTPIYGASATVQPPAIKLIPVIRY